ncbi:MAG: anti-sigma factor [Caldimonas sp.]
MTMDSLPPPAGDASPITEADLHAYVDGQLGSTRHAEVDAFLASRPDERDRVSDWRRQNERLHHLLDPVLDEPLPRRLAAPREAARWRGLAAGVAAAVASAGLAWTTRGWVDDARAGRPEVAGEPAGVASSDGDLRRFAQRAAIAHAVYSPEVRRPVEVSADQEQALITWLTKRLGTTIRAPKLGALGYELIGGRLLPGGSGPVAQFMYGKAGGQRLTLYVTREVAGRDTTFRFVREGLVNTFYWVEDRFGYAISAGADRDELLRVSEEVWRQLKPA